MKELALIAYIIGIVICVLYYLIELWKIGEVRLKDLYWLPYLSWLSWLGLLIAFILMDKRVEAFFSKWDVEEHPSCNNARLALKYVKAKGCLTEYERILLTESGINILHMLADHYHLKYGRLITIAEVRTMIKEQKVSWEDVEIVMDRFQTYTGINLKL